MKSIKIVLSIFAILFIFVSCEKNIEFKGEITDPQVVVNSYITPDSVVSAHISESRFFLNDSTTFRNINNADVAVWVNGTFKEKMSLVGQGIYKGTYKPVVGETIKLVVNVPSKKEVTCEANIYPQPVINSIDTVGIRLGEYYLFDYSNYSSGAPMLSDTIGTYSLHQINYTLKFSDNGNEKNYYRLSVLTKRYYTQTDSVTHVQTQRESDIYDFFSFTDVVSGKNTKNDPMSLVGGDNYIETYNVFSDELFNGKTYSLTFSTTNTIFNYRPTYKFGSKNPDKTTISIYLQSISKEYYLYLKSRAAASGGENFFSEPIQIYNNIVGGIGILGSYSTSKAVSFDL